MPTWIESLIGVETLNGSLSCSGKIWKFIATYDCYNRYLAPGLGKHKH